MQAVISFPDISNEIFSITLFGRDFALRWYAVSYIVGILLGWWFILRTIRDRKLYPQAPATADQIGDLVVWSMLGIIIGGRIGWDLI